MKQHKHKSIDGSQRGYGSGIEPPACNAKYKYCPTRGAHITTRCKCGAVGVICPQRKRMFWQGAL